MEKAIFLDRDGTINEEMGYINHPSRLVIFPFVAESIRLIREAGYKAVVITNQAGIARGYFKESVLQEVHARMNRILKEQGAELDGLYFCPHHPTEGAAPYRMDCNCRKPKPGMVLQAQKDLNINLEESWMIGDRYKDIVFAQKLGLQSAMVKTGYGLGEYTYQRDNWEHDPQIMAENLLEAVRQITGSRLT
jgi:D-glycero-D-manno-heptose 1,7-bisphosphate phosphatase